MAERFKAAVLKTVERKLRGFESLSLRHKINNNFEFMVQSSEKQKIKRKQILSFELCTEVKRRGGREAEGSCLLSSCGGNSTPGSNPGLSASLK
jgi:hypothetical protein